MENSLTKSQQNKLKNVINDPMLIKYVNTDMLPSEFKDFAVITNEFNSSLTGGEKDSLSDINTSDIQTNDIVDAVNNLNTEDLTTNFVNELVGGEVNTELMQELAKDMSEYDVDTDVANEIRENLSGGSLDTSALADIIPTEALLSQNTSTLGGGDYESLFPEKLSQLNTDELISLNDKFESLYPSDISLLS